MAITSCYWPSWHKWIVEAALFTGFSLPSRAQTAAGIYMPAAFFFFLCCRSRTEIVIPAVTMMAHPVQVHTSGKSPNQKYPSTVIRMIEL